MGRKDNPILPESQGLIVGFVYIILMVLFLPVPFAFWLHEDQKYALLWMIIALGALLSITVTLLLGFADDVLELKWRYKLVIPTIACFPLLVIYHITSGSTFIVVPLQLRPILGEVVNLGVLYYIFMVMLGIFCTNTVNILAGINGLEVGQSVVVAIFFIIFNLLELKGDFYRQHLFSLWFMIPFLFVSLGLLRYNWYPASVFVGDTYCYFAGMTFACVAILGHFNKTALLFFVPQMLNFVYSIPQLFHLIPCPRHRLPQFDSENNVRYPSVTTFYPARLGLVGRCCYWVIRKFRLADVRSMDSGIVERKNEKVEMSNLTLINFVLCRLGNLHERTLTIVLLLIQVLCNCFGLLIRYEIMKYFYDVSADYSSPVNVV